MGKWKKFLRLYLVPIIAVWAALWLWHNYGDAELWWWPIGIAIILAVEIQFFLQRRRKLRLQNENNDENNRRSGES